MRSIHRSRKVNEGAQTRPLVILGAGGHAKVLLSLIQAAGLEVLGVSAPELVEQGLENWRGVPVLTLFDDNLNAFPPENIALVNGVGNQTVRHGLFEKFKAQGYFFPVLIHPQAWVDASVVLDEGAQVMAGAVIQADACIGKNVIINTRASVDHDCAIGDHVHIAPGAILCGHVQVKQNAFIASGATVITGICVGENAVAGAGASIVRDIAPGHVILPAPVCIRNGAVV